MYKELFQIELTHPYFMRTGATELCMVPDRATRRFLKGRNCLLRPSQDGLRVLIPVDQDGNPRTAMLPTEVLTFEIYPGSSAFSSFTDTSELGPGEVFHFSNADLSASVSELDVTPAQASGAMHGYPMIAIVDIHLTAALTGRTQPATYQAVFKAKTETWKYYFVADKETTDLKVEDRDEKLVFHRVNLENNASDQVGLSLKSNFPDANIMLFSSATSIVCSNQALKNLQLLRDGHVIIKHLPNPEVGDAAIKIIKI